MTRSLRASFVMSGLIAALMAFVSAVGVFAPQVYRDNALIAHTFPGQDLVTLVVAVPLLVVGLVLAARGSARGRVIWVAMLAYALYSYAFYVFAAAFNQLFLLYVAIFALSIYALLFSVPRIDVAETVSGFGNRAAKWIAVVYMALTAVGLAALWIGMSVGFLATGKVPAPIVASGHPTSVVFALDLSLIVPAMVLGAVWLLQGRAWGWLLAGVLSVKGTVYTLGLASATLFVQRAGLGNGGELPIWAVLTGLGALAAVTLLATRRAEPATDATTPRSASSGLPGTAG